MDPILIGLGLLGLYAVKRGSPGNAISAPPPSPSPYLPQVTPPVSGFENTTQQPIPDVLRDISRINNLADKPGDPTAQDIGQAGEYGFDAGVNTAKTFGVETDAGLTTAGVIGAGAGVVALTAGAAIAAPVVIIGSSIVAVVENIAKNVEGSARLNAKLADYKSRTTLDERLKWEYQNVQDFYDWMDKPLAFLENVDSHMLYGLAHGYFLGTPADRNSAWFPFSDGKARRANHFHKAIEQEAPINEVFPNFAANYVLPRTDPYVIDPPPSVIAKPLPTETTSSTPVAPTTGTNVLPGTVISKPPSLTTTVTSTGSTSTRRLTRQY